MDCVVGKCTFKPGDLVYICTYGYAMARLGSFRVGLNLTSNNSTVVLLRTGAFNRQMSQTKNGMTFLI